MSDGYSAAHDHSVLRPDLHVVSRLEGSVPHMIFFHLHEGRIFIRFGAAVTLTHSIFIVLVIFPSAE